MFTFIASRDNLRLKKYTMNLSENLCVDKELFSRMNVKENTMNLSENLCVDKELFSRMNVKENTMNLSEWSVDKKYILFYL
jgi:hypothetical protein